MDLHGALRQRYQDTGKLPVIPYDGHYLPEANRVMAAVMAPVVQELRAARSAKD